MASKKEDIYLKSFDEAVSSGEVEQYHASRKKNIECAHAIDKAIADSYKGDYIYELESAVKSVISDFGGERVKFVMAWHLQNQNYDGRISDENKSWANASDIPQATQSQNIYMKSHATLLDGFTSHLRKITENPEVGSYKIKKSVLFTNNRGIAFAESKTAVSPFVTWQFKVDENGGRDYYWGRYFSSKDDATADFKRRVTEYKADNRVEEVREKHDKSTDKPLTGMAKLRQSEKAKNNNSVPPLVAEDKSKRKKLEVDL